jgi:hypothetical protein
MIKTKRDSLEKFIRTQMEGPGACNNRFDFIDETQSEIDIVDVINTTPGSLYSTAVLFPKRIPNPNDNTNQGEEEGKVDEESDTPPDNIETNETNNESDIDNDIDEKNTIMSQSEEDDLYSLSQRFPNTIGISCCLDAGEININTKNVKITISGRYYTKIPKDKYSSVLVFVSENYPQFEIFYNEYKEKLSPYFLLKSNGISSIGNFSKNILDVKQILLDINLRICEEIAKKDNGEFDNSFSSIGGSYRYLKSYKERLWGKLKQITDEGQTYLSDQEKKSIIERIAKIELYETFLSYFEDVANLHNSKSFGYWTAQKFTKEIDLSNIDLNISSNKQIFSPKKFETLRNVVSFDVEESIQASLSVWLQVTKNSREENTSKRYLKIQLENTSTPFEEDSKHYFSIVTEKVNQRCFFGIEIKVESDLLCPYHHSSKNTDVNDDIDQLNFLYRSIKDYGIGHLCSVDWTINDNKKIVKSEFIPSFETPDVEPIPRDKYSAFVEESAKFVPKQLLEDTKALEFKWLSTFSDASNEEIITKLYDFVDAYGAWIERLNTKANEDEFAKQNILSCKQDYERMKSNIQLLLESNPTNIYSFRLMNSTMFIQLWHSKNSTNEKTTQEFYKNADDYIFGNFPATWRPFQIAFILLNLDGIFQRPDDPKWANRNELVDLVWFPTGGGKTEAYLGIIALTIINRRRNEDKNRNGGTTAIMRYTLRLLATQQFQRAMRVILALEQLRIWEETKLGSEPISIGLYVGDNSLPNNAADTTYSLGLLSESIKWNTFNGNKRVESKIPLDKCPWCGELLESQNKGTKSNPEVKFRCSNTHCTFSEELPIMLCDEYIYKTPPTLLFGTVDKFASIGHKVSTDKKEENKDSRRIFGKGLLNNLPPDLIIQDELHLLLGPLGSAVSLFESAIDQLCSYKKQLPDGTEIIVRPKIISSTATTRNTELQIRALYDRNVNIFPKSGIDYDDSFFAFFKREKIDNQEKFVAQRKYMGILPTGRTQMTTQMRLIATMFVHRALFEKEYAEKLSDKPVEKAIDFYHSIIAYFNSLKEVGKTDAQFYTEFTKYTRRLFKRVLRNTNMLECYYGYDSSFKKSELTGRLSGSEVVEQLAIVAKHWNANNRLPHKDESGEIWQRGETPPDLILATNMISVGLDVDRFNTIVMNSMPRNIAEYIQASSRVARNDLGLVVTLHNPFRSRDLSHFEKFREFHEKLYYYVEPISITPFSKKSVEKYLPLYLATMIRHTYDGLADQRSASSLNAETANNVKLKLIKYFEGRLNRTQKLDESQKNLLTNELEANIDAFIGKALDQWLRLADAQQTENYSLRYSGSDFLNRNNRNQTKYKDLFLALDAYEDENFETLWAVPMSLRNVESEAVISINEKQ